MIISILLNILLNVIHHTFFDDAKNLDKKLKIFSSENIQYAIDYDIDIDSVRKDEDKKLQTLIKRKENLGI